MKEEKIFLVRSAENFDINRIAELERICFGSQAWSEKAILDAKKNQTKFFVAVKQNTVAGYVGINTVLDEGYITNIAVDPDFRRSGAASALLECLDVLSEKQKLSFISLEVRVSNAVAISLYLKRGYKNEGERKNFYDDPKENAYIMTKRYKNDNTCD